MSDALLADDGVALGAQASAHEDVLNVAQAAELAVQQVLALPGAEQPPGDYDFAFLWCALKAAAANLEDYGLRTFARGVRFLRLIIFNHLAGLLVGDNFLGLGCAAAAHFVLVPVGGPFVFDHHLRLNGHRSLKGLGIDHGQGDFRHAERLAVAGSGEDDVLHVCAAQALGALLAQHPTDSIEDV